MQTPLLSTPALLCEESEGCETAIKRPAMRACRVIGTPFSPACNLSESTSIPEEPLDPTTESPGQQHPVSSGKCTRPVNRRCRLKPRSLTSPTVPSAERPTGGRSFTDVHACCEAAAGMDDAALGADILTAEALEPVSPQLDCLGIMQAASLLAWDDDLLNASCVLADARHPLTMLFYLLGWVLQSLMIMPSLDQPETLPLPFIRIKAPCQCRGKTLSCWVQEVRWGLHQTGWSF